MNKKTLTLIGFVAVMVTAVTFLHAASTPKVHGAASFSIPFNCGGTSSESICLADPFPAGRTVVLLKKDNTGTCTARTKDKFDYEGLNRSFEVTRLSISGRCTGPFTIAIIDVAATSVRLNNAKPDSQTLGQKFSKAREILRQRQSSFAPEASIYQLSGANPKIIGSDEAVLFAYTIKSDPGRGPHVLFLGDGIFISEGWCTSGHTFFSVQNRLYLGYVKSGCGGGEYVALIYELTSGKPKEIFANTKFST